MNIKNNLLYNSNKNYCGVIEKVKILHVFIFRVSCMFLFLGFFNIYRIYSDSSPSSNLQISKTNYPNI